MWNQIIQLFETSTAAEIAVALVVLVLSLLLLIRLVTSSKRNMGPDVTLILGPCGSGKTTMFYKWQSPKLKAKTVTSQSINRGFVFGKNEVIDYPGHPRLRGGLSTLIPRARKIVFLLDSSDTMDGFKSAAELLYDIFVMKGLRPDAQMLIGCHKSDLEGSRDCNAVEKILNDQIELLRKSRMQGELEGDNSVDQYLGVDDEPFDLNNHSPIRVEFTSSNIKKLVDIESFISS